MSFCSRPTIVLIRRIRTSRRLFIFPKWFVFIGAPYAKAVQLRLSRDCRGYLVASATFGGRIIFTAVCISVCLRVKTVFFIKLVNTRLPEATAAADIHLHVTPRPASASVCTTGTWARPPICDQPLLRDECPPTCSTGSLAGSVPNIATPSVTKHSA